MNKYIKSAAALALLTLGFAASCDDDDDARAVYPEKESLTTWASEWTGSDEYDYSVNFSLDAAGDTVGTFQLTEKATGTVYSFLDGSCSYDPSVGMTTIEFADSPFGTPARVYVARQRTNSRMSMQWFLNTSGSSYVYQASAGLVPVAGFWVAGSTFAELANPSSPAIRVSFADGANATVALGGAAAVSGTYTWDTATAAGSIALADGTSVTLSVNASNQLVAAAGGQSYALARVR